MSSPIRLRIHHFICLQSFREKGYSPAFKKNARAVLAALEMPGATVQAVTGVDDLCGCCPRNERQAQCADNHLVSMIDDAYENTLEIHPGRILPWEEAKQLIASRVSDEEFEINCAACGWRVQGDCRKALALLRRTHSLQSVGPV